MSFKVLRPAHYITILSFLCSITVALEPSCAPQTETSPAEGWDDHFSLLQRTTRTLLHIPPKESAIEQPLEYRTSEHQLWSALPSIAAPLAVEELLSTVGWPELGGHSVVWPVAETRPLQHDEKVQNLGQTPDLVVESVDQTNSSIMTNTTHSVGNYWSGMNGNLASTGASPYAVSKDFTGGPTWNFTVDSPFGLLLGHSEVVGTPLIDSLRNIYLTTIYGKVLKFDVDGTSMWNQSVGASVNVTPTIADGSLHLATVAGEAVSLDMTTGSVTWRRMISLCKSPSARAVMSSAGVVVHALYFADDDCSTRTYFNALDAKNGSELWTYSPLDFTGHRGPPVGLFAIEGSFIVFTDIDGNVCKLDLKSGKELWGHDSQILLVTNASMVPKHPNATKKQVNRSFNGSESSSGSVDRTLLEEGGGRQASRKLAFLQGHEESSHSAEFQIAMRGSGAVVGPDMVVFVASNPLFDHGARAGRLEALNFTTGKLLWQVNLGHTISTGPVVGQLHPGGKGNLSVLVTVGNTSHIASTDDGRSPARRIYSGKVLAFAAVTGAAQNWTYEQPPWSKDEGACLSEQAFSNPAIGGDGTVYVGSGNGMLYAIRDHDGDGFVNETLEVNSYAAGHAFIASPAIAPGLLVAAPCNGMVVFKQF